jgi:hypothetical protein
MDLNVKLETVLSPLRAQGSRLYPTRHMLISIFHEALYQLMLPNIWRWETTVNCIRNQQTVIQQMRLYIKMTLYAILLLQYFFFFFFFFLRRYNFREVLAFSTSFFHLIRFLMQSFQFIIFILTISLFTSSIYLLLEYYLHKLKTTLKFHIVIVLLNKKFLHAAKFIEISVTSLWTCTLLGTMNWWNEDYNSNNCHNLPDFLLQ